MVISLVNEFNFNKTFKKKMTENVILKILLKPTNN